MYFFTVQRTYSMKANATAFLIVLAYFYDHQVKPEIFKIRIKQKRCLQAAHAGYCRNNLQKGYW